LHVINSYHFLLLIIIYNIFAYNFRYWFLWNIIEYCRILYISWSLSILIAYCWWLSIFIDYYCLLL